jgi:hypothetical protein
MSRTLLGSVILYASRMVLGQMADEPDGGGAASPAQPLGQQPQPQPLGQQQQPQPLGQQQQPQPLGQQPQPQPLGQQPQPLVQQPQPQPQPLGQQPQPQPQPHTAAPPTAMLVLSKKQRAEMMLFKVKGKPLAETMADHDFVSNLAKELDMEEMDINNLLKEIKDSLDKETKKLVPNGFTPTENNVINPLLSDGARPTLTLNQANALSVYTGGAYEFINDALRAGKIPDGPLGDVCQQMQTAFDDIKEFPPVTVKRGINFKDQTQLMNFLQPFLNNICRNEPVTLMGFTSTGTAGTPDDFKGNVSLKIIAKKGLDLNPYSKTPKEKELLLNHNTTVKVHSCAKKGDKWVLVLEQIIPKEPQPPDKNF